MIVADWEVRDAFGNTVDRVPTLITGSLEGGLRVPGLIAGDRLYCKGQLVYIEPTSRTFA